MSTLFPNFIEYVYVRGIGPGLREHAPRTLQINATSTVSLERYIDVKEICHIYAASAFSDNPEVVVKSQDVPTV